MRTSTPEHLTSKRTVPVKPTGEAAAGEGVIIQLGEDKENRSNPNIPMSGIQNALMQKAVMAGSPGNLQNGTKSSGQIAAGSKRRLSNLTSTNLEPKAGHLYSASYISGLNSQHGSEEAKVSQAERSLGNPLITGGSSPREILELHQRSLTPKTVNELLAEKRKKLSQSPGLGANSPPGTKAGQPPVTGMKFAKQLPIKVHELLHGHSKSASNASQVANSKQGSPQLGPPQQSNASSSLNLSKKTLPTPADASSGKMSSSTRQSLAQGGLISNGSLAAAATAGTHKASSPNFYQNEHKTVNQKPNGVYPIKSIAFSSSQANTQQGSPGRTAVGVAKRNTVGNGSSS